MAEAALEKDTLPERLPFAFARRFGVALAGETGGEGETEEGGRKKPQNDRVTLICRQMPPLATLAEARRFAGRALDVQTVGDARFDELLAQLYARDASEAKQMVEDIGEDLSLARLADSVPETEDLLEQEDDAPIIRLINALLAEAIREDASDIHVETFERDLVVRFRVDGVMREAVRPKRALAPLLVSRIKVMARLDIAEKRIPQDGRIPLRIGAREVDVRVSTLPSAHGERVVLRLLDKQAGRLTLPNLGMGEGTLARLQQVLERPHGIFLVTGPTGSGKTTTLYASLTELSTRTMNILTIENPIEYNLVGIGQTQVNEKADMTFARGLRAILRQDPDVVMVGEVRDLETAQIAIQASLTGHLVMSTLHTNTAIGAVTRLVDQGVEPFLVASSLAGVLAQRLVRVLCGECKRESRPDAVEQHFLGDATPGPVWHAVGCEACGHTGFRGRVGIYELVLLDDHMRELIHDRAAEHTLATYASERAPTLRADGRAKVLAGLTTVEEVLRVTLEDRP